MSYNRLARVIADWLE